MNIFISGGCKNGKSYYAQRSAKALAESSKRPLYYIATMIPHDEEDRERIRRHISEREGWGFQTIEQGRNLLELLDMDIAGEEAEKKTKAKRIDPDRETKALDLSGVFLLDSITAVLENEMYPVALKNREPVFLGEDITAPERVKHDMIAFAEAVAAAGGSVVFVSDGIYGDTGKYSPSTENYRRALAGCDRAVAGVCDKVVEIAYGNAEIWKQE